jgi:hypothetical protein
VAAQTGTKGPQLSDGLGGFRLIIKIVVVVVAGVGVFLHQGATTKRATALWGAVGAIASVAALCLGVFLAG